MLSIKNIWEKVQYFFAYHTMSMYAGLGLGVVSLTILTSFLPNLLSGILCPVLSEIAFLATICVKWDLKDFKTNAFLRQEGIGVLLGSLFVLLFFIFA